ncbi:MAG: DMT family transporter [Firmicutes bacterium]|nr:DMT family transporter [Bacillota bacterium]
MWILSTFLASALFAASSMFNKIAMGEDTPTDKLLPGTFLAGFLVLLVKQGRAISVPSWPLVLSGLAMSLLSMLNCVAILLAIRSGPMGKVAAVAGSHSLVTPLLALFIFGERLNFWQWVAVGIATLGMILVQYKKEEKTETATWVWFGLAFLGALGSSGETLVLDKATVLQGDGISGLVWSYLFSFVFTSLWFLRRRQRRFTRPFYLGAADGAVSALGMIFFAHALAGGPAGLVAALSTSAVAMRAIGGRLFFSERLSLSSWIGIALSVCAFALVSFF